VVEGFCPNAHCLKGIPSHNKNWLCLEDTWPCGVLLTLLCEHPDSTFSECDLKRLFRWCAVRFKYFDISSCQRLPFFRFFVGISWERQFPSCWKFWMLQTTSQSAVWFWFNVILIFEPFCIVMLWRYELSIIWGLFFMFDIQKNWRKSKFPDFSCVQCYHVSICFQHWLYNSTFFLNCGCRR